MLQGNPRYTNCTMDAGAQKRPAHVGSLRAILWLMALTPTTLFLIWLVRPVQAGDMLPAAGVECLAHIKIIATAAELYAGDYDDRLPFANNWADALNPYLPTGFILDCPKLDREQRQKGLKVRESTTGEANATYGYAYNKSVAASKTTAFKHPAETVIFFESNLLRRNAAGGVGLLPVPGRHDGANSIAFIDGHARQVKPEESLTWK